MMTMHAPTSVEIDVPRKRTREFALYAWRAAAAALILAPLVHVWGAGGTMWMTKCGAQTHASKCLTICSVTGGPRSVASLSHGCEVLTAMRKLGLGVSIEQLAVVLLRLRDTGALCPVSGQQSKRQCNGAFILMHSYAVLVYIHVSYMVIYSSLEARHFGTQYCLA